MKLLSMIIAKCHDIIPSAFSAASSLGIFSSLLDKGISSRDVWKKTTQVSKENKISELLSAAIQARINSYFSRDGMETLCMGICGVLSSLSFHLTGILEAVILIKSQLAEITHLKARGVA